MAKTTSIRVNERKTAGKGAARAERRAGLIPGVIYGEKKRTRDVLYFRLGSGRANAPEGFLDAPV